MRTTVDLPPPLLRQARKRADATGTTLSVFVAEAVRAFLASAREPEARFKVVTFGTRGAKFPTDREIQDAVDADDDASLNLPPRKG